MSALLPPGGRALRIAGIVLLALTTVFNLMGGIGTTCVALAPTRWGVNMARLAPFQWLYQLLVVVTVATAIWSLIATVALARGRKNAYRDALIALFLSMVSAAVQMIASQALRGGDAPENMRFYLTGLTLVVLLLFRLPPIWGVTGFTWGAQSDWQTPTGLAAFAGGIVALSTRLWVGVSHIGPDGANWVDVLRLPLLLGGTALALAGIGLLWWARHEAVRQAAMRRTNTQLELG